MAQLLADTITVGVVWPLRAASSTLRSAGAAAAAADASLALLQSSLVAPGEGLAAGVLTVALAAAAFGALHGCHGRSAAAAWISSAIADALALALESAYAVNALLVAAWTLLFVHADASGRSAPRRLRQIFMGALVSSFILLFSLDPVLSISFKVILSGIYLAIDTCLSLEEEDLMQQRGGTAMQGDTLVCLRIALAATFWLIVTAGLGGFTALVGLPPRVVTELIVPAFHAVAAAAAAVANSAAAPRALTAEQALEAAQAGRSAAVLALPLVLRAAALAVAVALRSALSAARWSVWLVAATGAIYALDCSARRLQAGVAEMLLLAGGRGDRGTFATPEKRLAHRRSLPFAADNEALIECICCGVAGFGARSLPPRYLPNNAVTYARDDGDDNRFFLLVSNRPSLLAPRKRMCTPHRCRTRAHF